MKKSFAIVLAVCLLILSGCNIDLPIEIGGEVGETGEATLPENLPTLDFNAPAMSVTVAMGPELELTLSFSEKILEVKTLNADGEKLLESMDLVGAVYCNGMAALLEQAKEQGFLKDGATVALTARELMTDTWTVASQSILTRPVEAFREKAGITLEWTMDPAGDDLPPVIAKTHTNHGDDGDEVICYNAANRHVITKRTFANGDYAESYYGSNEYIIWENDGSYEYHGTKGGYSVAYTHSPDGWWTTVINLYDADGDPIWRLSADSYATTEWLYQNGKVASQFTTYSDGSTMEALFEDGKQVHALYLGSDGSRQESFYEKGEPVHSLNSYPDGATHELFYENGELVRSLESRPDGSTSELFYENGELVRAIDTDPDGTVHEREVQGGAVAPETVPPETAPSDGSTYEATYYGNGNIESEKTTWPNGDYIYETYYEDGTISSFVYQMEGVYAEVCYDENGNQLSYYCLDADGSECRETYENGVRVSVAYTDANGNYSESHYDESGNQLSQYQVDADGGEYRVTYENGVRVSSTETEANGNYTNVTYYANGERASCISYRDGYYMEDYYRENGNLISSYSKDSDSEIKWTYDENGEMTSYEETFADGAYCLDTYENGVHILSKGYGSDGLYWENVYDENGKLIKTIREVAPGQFVEDNLE